MVLIKGKAIRTSLLIFRTLVNFCAHMGLCPGAKTAPPQFCSTRTSPLLFRDKNRPFNRKVLGKPFEFKTYLLDYNKFDMSPINHTLGRISPLINDDDVT